jgi:hypothetical protein
MALAAVLLFFGSVGGFLVGLISRPAFNACFLTGVELLVATVVILVTVDLDKYKARRQKPVEPAFISKSQAADFARFYHTALVHGQRSSAADLFTLWYELQSETVKPTI